MIDISIITPLYNSEEYLFKCLDSIYSNDIFNVEHILVNDGSPGFSTELLNEIKTKYYNTKIINKYMNEGIGLAYRDAFKIAEGRYIMFLDADDYFSSDTLKEIKAVIASDCPDIIQFGRKIIDGNGNVLGEDRFAYKRIKSKTAIWSYCFKEVKFPGLSIRAFKRELFDDINIIGQSIAIDDYLTPQLIYNANSMTVIDKCFYYCLKHNNNVSGQSISKRYLQNTFNAYNSLINLYNDDNAFCKYTYEKYLTMLITSYINILNSTISSISKKELLDVSDYYVMKRITKRFKGAFDSDFHYALKCKCFIYFPVLFNLFYTVRLNKYKGKDYE